MANGQASRGVVGSTGAAGGTAPRVEAIDRALLLLTVMMDAGGRPLSLAELTERARIAKPTCYRALSTMRRRGFVEQDVETSQYRLGPMAMRLGETFAGTRNLAGALHPVLVRLSRATGELVHLGVLSGDRMLYIDKVEPERSIRVWSAVGQTVPVATTALGRAVLATRDLTDQQLGSYLLSAPGTSVAELRAAVDAARARGYSEEHGENEPDVACVGVALLREGTAVAAVSVTCLQSRMTASRQAELVRIIREELPPTLPGWLTLMEAM